MNVISSLTFSSDRRVNDNIKGVQWHSRDTVGPFNV